MLLAVAPPASVAFLVAPSVYTEAMLFVLSVEALVHPPVLPGVDSEFVHNVPAPVPNVPAAIRPLIVPVAADLILLPLALI